MVIILWRALMTDRGKYVSTSVKSVTLLKKNGTASIVTSHGMKDKHN